MLCIKRSCETKRGNTLKAYTVNGKRKYWITQRASIFDLREKGREQLSIEYYTLSKQMVSQIIHNGYYIFYSDHPRTNDTKDSITNYFAFFPKGTNLMYICSYIGNIYGIQCSR